MATYTHLEEPTTPPLAWLVAGIGGFAQPVQSDVVVLANGDGTFTRLVSAANDLTYDQINNIWTGTISSISRTNNIAGTVTFEQITGFTIAASTFFAAGSPAASIGLVLAGADTFTGWSGNDTLLGSASADSYDGGSAGIDFVAYSISTAVLADLGTPANNTGDALGDTYVSIEGLIGGNGDDTLRGNGVNNTLIGGEGNDVLRGRGGADSLNGGNGTDFADYGNLATSVVVSLATPASNTNDALGDTFTSIEGLIGGTANDTLIGDGANNFLRGSAGADSLDGGAGFDYATTGMLRRRCWPTSQTLPRIQATHWATSTRRSRISVAGISTTH